MTQGRTLPWIPLKPIYHHRRHGTGVIVNAWAILWACGYVYGKAIVNALDWLGQKLVDLIDHSDFFAGMVWTYTIMTVWELLAKK